MVAVIIATRQRRWLLLLRHGRGGGADCSLVSVRHYYEQKGGGRIAGEMDWGVLDGREGVAEEELPTSHRKDFESRKENNESE